MGAALTDLIRSARLWRIWLRLGVQDVRLRFRRSLIGPGWIFLNLTVMVLALGYIYGHLFGQDMRTFLPFLTAGLVIWGYLSASIAEGSQAFVASEGYIKQIALPIYVYVFRFFVSITLTSAISFGAFVVAALVFRLPLGLGTLWVLPGLVLIMLTSFLLVTILAHVNARFRDAGNLAGVFMQIGFFVTPVMFPAELLLKSGRTLIVQLNPLYHVLEVVRRPLLESQPAAALNYVGSAVFILTLLVLALLVLSHFGRRIVFSL
jgi:ABC-type polysaccharide/polyol phosphate export permease